MPCGRVAVVLRGGNRGVLPEGRGPCGREYALVVWWDGRGGVAEEGRGVLQVLFRGGEPEGAVGVLSVSGLSGRAVDLAQR